MKFSLVWWKKWQKIGIWWNWVSVGRFWNFGFSQFHRDWLNHRGAGAWKGCSSGSFSNSFLKILCRKKRRILKRKENEKGCISNSYLYNLRNVPLQPRVERKKCGCTEKAAVHNKFISTDAREIRSLREWQKIDPGPLDGWGNIGRNSSKPQTL